MAAQRAACDEMLREAESAEICAAVQADAQSNPGRTCHVWYHRTCIPSRRNLIVQVPIGHINLLVHGVATREFDALTIKWH